MMKDLKVLHTSWTNDHLGGGGVSTSIRALNNELIKRNIQSEWITPDRYHPIFADRKLSKDLIEQKPSLIHIHGLWRSPTRIANKLFKKKLPFVLSPHGMLNPIALSQSKLKKKLVWKLWEKKSLNFANCFHALSLSEVKSIKKYFPSKKVALIPNSVSKIVFSKDYLPTPPWEGLIPKNEKVLLFLGRYHHGKGVKPLLNAWTSLGEFSKKNGWWLVLVGYGDNNQLIKENEKNPIPRCKVFGPACDLLKYSCYANASAFILPSFFEALPMAALEAMNYKLPTLLSKACNLQENFKMGASIISNPEKNEIANAIKQLISLSDNERKEMGQSGRILVCNNYSSEKVSESMIKFYNWVLLEENKPDFIM